MQNISSARINRNELDCGAAKYCFKFIYWKGREERGVCEKEMRDEDIFCPALWHRR